MEERVKLVHLSYSDLLDKTKYDYDGLDKTMDFFTEKAREALLNKPSGYFKDEPYAIVALIKNRAIGCTITFTTYIKAYGEIVLAQSGSYLFAIEEYRKYNAGSFIFYDAINLLKSKNCIYGGISQDALGLYKPFRFSIFEFARLIYLRKSRSVIEHFFKTESAIIKPIIWLADGFLWMHRSFHRKKRFLANYQIIESREVPDDVVSIIEEDSHPYSEYHDKKWIEWNLHHTFREDSRIRKKLFLVKQGERIEAFFIIKEEFFERASRRGFKNVFLGSVMEWGIKKESTLTEDQLYMLSIDVFSSDIDGIQVATNDHQVISRLKKKLFVGVGNANMAVRVKDPKFDDISDINKWRLRLACGDTLID